MRLMYLDLETTGLDPTRDQVIEVGAILDDLGSQRPLDELPYLRLVVNRERYSGQPKALAMHGVLLNKIANHADDLLLCDEDEVAYQLAQWLSSHDWPSKVTVAGKNVAGFDVQFLLNLPGFRRDGSKVRFGDHEFRQRVVDPGIFYMWPGHDDCIPDTKTCLSRAGIGGQSDHTAIGDCRIVAELVRRYWNNAGLWWQGSAPSDPDGTG